MEVENRSKVRKAKHNMCHASNRPKPFEWYSKWFARRDTRRILMPRALVVNHAPLFKPRPRPPLSPSISIPCSCSSLVN
ncbi:hypothetical protein Scep_007952 [Stephania cephalantha]|uniref:Uncharacterized protein n=1 Tax=Stephania cephalantha TaxID=152367 RepID=A0AAP0KC22_9MAGN